MRRILWLSLCIALFAAAPALAAQSVLQPGAEPEFGIVSIAPGFAPDPLRVPAMTGGGDIDAVNRQLGPDCAGFITAAPDVRLTVSAELPLLRLIFIADAITTDTTLIVRAPDGAFWCNNNSSGLFNPMVSISAAAPGDYAVWVGGFTPDVPVFGELFVTARDDARPGSTGLVLPVATTVPTPVPAGLMTPTPLPGTFLDPSRTPAHADVALAHGFLPDPFWTVVIGGGELAAPPLDTGNPATSQCAGYVTSEPDMRLNWAGVSPGLRFHLLPSDEFTDAALIVHTPDGRWLCNTTFAPGYTDPSVVIDDPAEGVYTVWAANQSTYGARFTAALFATEINSTPETVRRPGTPALTTIAGLDPFAPSNPVIFGQNTPDPLALSAPLGFPAGAVDVAALNPPAEGQRAPACNGFVPAAPTLTVDLSFPYPYLRVFFVGAEGSDPVLILRLPDGRWFCNDDSYNGKNPTIDVLGPPVSGVAQVWVGSYSAQDEGIVGTVYFTRGSATPVSPGASTPFTGLTEINLAPPAVPAQVFPTAIALSTGPLTPGAAPNYGSVTLASADPAFTVQAIGGGEQDASKAAPGCIGAVSAAPDFRLDWQGPPAPLRLFFSGEGDPTLVVIGPDGVVRCSDDSLSSQMPLIDLPAASAGAWFVWVGSFDPAATVPGTLTITADVTQTPLTP
jgi:serine protease Do